MFHQISQKKKDKFTTNVVAQLKASSFQISGGKKNPIVNAMPKPLLCDPSICRQTVKPTCKTMIQPQFNGANNMQNSLIGEGNVHIFCFVRLL
jgi:hypothetical protein